MSVAIGCDHLGLNLKNKIIEAFTKKGYQFEDYGTYDDKPINYPEIGFKVAKSVSSGKHKRGILICGTGIGMSITANKVKGIFAAVCHDLYSTERSILSNNIQIMCLGALVIGQSTAITMVNKWLELDFKESPSLKKIEMIHQIETGRWC